MLFTPEAIFPGSVDTYVVWRQEEGISDTTIGHEVVFLRGVCDWATQRRGKGGIPLLPFNPIADARRIRSEEPNTPDMTPERFLRIYRQADRVDMQGLLRPLLMLVNEHGWRLSAWCKMWASDIDLRPWSPRPGVVWPHGRIRKRRANNKGRKKDKWVPLTRRSRRAAVRLLRRAGVIGDTPIFQAPKVDGPWQPQHALDLLHRAELAVSHAERLAFLHSQAVVVADRVRVRIGRADYPLAEYLHRHGDKVAASLRFAAKLVGRVNEAMGWAWSASLEPETGFGYHSMRRAWGSARKDEPLVDVAEAGDWHPGTLLGHYQKPDPETTLRVVLGGKRRAAGRQT